MLIFHSSGSHFSIATGINIRAAQPVNVINADMPVPINLSVYAFLVIFHCKDNLLSSKTSACCHPSTFC